MCTFACSREETKRWKGGWGCLHILKWTGGWTFLAWENENSVVVNQFVIFDRPLMRSLSLEKLSQIYNKLDHVNSANL